MPDRSPDRIAQLRRLPQDRRPAWYSRQPALTAELNWAYACWTYAHPVASTCAMAAFGTLFGLMAEAVLGGGYPVPLLPFFAVGATVGHLSVVVVMERFGRSSPA